MRRAHGYRICRDLHPVIKTIYRDLKGRIAFGIDRLIFLFSDPHIIVIRTAENDLAVASPCFTVIFAGDSTEARPEPPSKTTSAS